MCLESPLVALVHLKPHLVIIHEVFSILVNIFYLAIKRGLDTNHIFRLDTILSPQTPTHSHASYTPIYHGDTFHDL